VAGRQIEIPLYSKAPFANYDIVVYLGGGLFTLLLAWRYIVEPFDIFDLSFLTDVTGASWTSQVMLIVVLGVLSYVAGHLISYLSSHFIQGFADRTLGTFSSIIKLATLPREQFDERLAKQIDLNWKESFSLFPARGWLIVLFHIPMIFWYFPVKWLCLFNCLDTRIPARMFDSLDEKMKKHFKGVSLENEKQWFRWVEYYTSYNAPIAASSMYNYLVISGLMRSLAFLLLGAMWAEIFHIVLWKLEDIQRLHVGKDAIHWIFYGGALVIGYVCALTAYLKFYRRYVEEAVMGFLLEIPE
jgi:hypothetical protein